MAIVPACSKIQFPNAAIEGFAVVEQTRESLRLQALCTHRPYRLRDAVMNRD